MLIMQVTVLSPKEGTISYAGQTSADSVLMNPVQPIIALKGNNDGPFFYHTAVEWNALDNSVIHAGSVDSFKTLLKLKSWPPTISRPAQFPQCRL
jgi:hypothetical protein